MTSAEHRATARSYLEKARQFLLLAETGLGQADNAAVSNAVHAGISSKDAICTALTGATGKSDDHAQAVPELKKALGQRPDATAATKALRSLLADKTPAQYSSKLLRGQRAVTAVGNARLLVEIAEGVLAGG